MRTFFLWSCLIVFSACQNTLTQEDYYYGDDFELALGEKVRVGVDKVLVEFVDVLEDSRCPKNVTCVWAGNGKVHLRFSNHELQLNTYLEPHDTTISESQIELISLDPYPEHPEEIDKDDYKVRLLIKKQ